MPVDLQTGEDKTVSDGNYTLSDNQLQSMRRDRRNIDNDLLYRGQFEPYWKLGATKWNLVAPPSLQGTPNYVVPISRMATHTGIVSMRQSLPEIIPVPEGADEKKLSYLLGEASAHVHRMTNMEAVLDQGMVDYAVLGNMILESYVKVPFKTKRVAILNEKGEETGKYKTVTVRDWSKPKIGTRSRSPWECAFDSGARTPSEIRRCWWQEKMSKAEFDERFTNKPGNDYINLKHVQEGKVWSFGDKGELERVAVDHDRIIVDNVQNELEDAWRIYANGVLIWDVPLSKCHAHGKITLSLIPNHHKYDKNGRTHALYGAGDPELLEDLDDLVNAFTNLLIQNLKLKNTYVVGVDGGLPVDEIDLESGMPISGKVTVQSLGSADVGEWQAIKQSFEQWAVQIVKKNYMRLEGEVAKTAYEAAQKKQAENVGQEHQIKKMESGGLLEYARKHVSDIMEHMTVEEWSDVVDKSPKEIQELIDAKELAQEDVVFDKDTKTPLKIRYIEKFRTRRKVYQDDMLKGKRDLQNVKELCECEGEDGWLPAAKEYLQTRSWRLYKKVPDVYLIGKTMLGQDDLVELSKIEQMVNNLTLINNLEFQAKQYQIDMGMDFDSMREKAITAIGAKREEFLPDENSEEGTKIEEDIRMAEQLMQQARLTPPPSAQAPVQAPMAPVPGGTPDMGAGPAVPAGPQADQALQ